MAQVTDVQTSFMDEVSFLTTVSWIERIWIEDESNNDEGGYNSYSIHSQLLFGSLSESSGADDESSDMLVASWDDDSTGAMHHQSTNSDDESSQTSLSSIGDKMLASVAVQGDWAVQGFCNHSTMARSAGVVFFYAKIDVATSENSEVEGSSKAWFLQQSLYPSVTYGGDDDEGSLNGAYFGSAVALDSSTGVLAIGAHGLDRVFMYGHNQTFWQLHSMLSASDDTSGGAMFGMSLQLLNSNQLVVGSPYSMDSSGVQSGAVYKFAYLKDLSQWKEVSKVEAINATAGTCFGSSIVAVENYLYLVTASPAAVVKHGGEVTLTTEDAAITTRIFSMNFTDCAMYTTCTDAFYNETSNVTTSEECVSYSSCTGDKSSDIDSNNHNSTRLVFFLVFVGGAVLLLPALVLGATMFQQRLRNRRGEYLNDDDGRTEAAPVLRMTPLNTLEEGGGGGAEVPAGSVGESPVGRPPLADGARKGRGSKSYSALTSQAQVEVASPLATQQQQETAKSFPSTSVSTVGGLLNKLRGVGGTDSLPSTKATDEKAPLASSEPQGEQLSDINSPGGPPRLPIKTKSPFQMPSVEE